MLFQDNKQAREYSNLLKKYAMDSEFLRFLNLTISIINSRREQIFTETGSYPKERDGIGHLMEMTYNKKQEILMKYKKENGGE